LVLQLNYETVSLTHKYNYIQKIITNEFTLVGSVGPCRANKEAQRNLQNNKLYKTHGIQKCLGVKRLGSYKIKHLIKLTQGKLRTKIGHGDNDLLLSNKLPCPLLTFPAYSENIKEVLHCILN
jgi:hypothetical protein